MQKRYALMTQLRDHLTELFELCGVPAKQIPVEPAPVPLRWLEVLLRDRGLYGYLEELDGQAKRAIRESRERNLDLWNARQNELLLEQQEKELWKLRRQLQEQTPPTASVSPDGGQLEMVRDIIAMRDHLLMRKRWIRDFTPDEESAAKLVDGQLLETAKLLERAGVEIMEQTGAFDCRIHTVAETRPAPSLEREGQIAETFRPGYRFHGEILRPQEVILYVKA